jgi:hypothetical protein
MFFPHSLYPGPYRMTIVPRGKGPAGYSRIPGRPALKHVPGAFGGPLGHDPVSLAVRIHEYAHIAIEGLRIVPPHALEQLLSEAPHLQEDVIQAVMDVIANTYATLSGLPRVCHLPVRDYSRASPRARFLAALRYQTLGANRVLLPEEERPRVDARNLARLPYPHLKAMQRLHDVIDSTTRDFAWNRVHSPRSRSGWTLNKLLSVCEAVEDAIQAMLDEERLVEPTPSEEASGEEPGGESGEEPGGESREGKKEPTPPGIGTETSPKGPPVEEPSEKGGDGPAGEDPWASYTAPVPPPLPEEREARKLLQTEKRPRYPFEKGEDEDAPWGHLAIKTPRLGAFHKRAQVLAVRPIPGFYGPFRFPHRALPGTGDGKAFGLKARRRARGGTVLLDVSGSMNLNPEDIRRLLTTAPAATIAMYSARENLSGELFILAHRGRQVADIPRHGGANIVDGPALRWLLRQRPPRIWVSDGRVTGTYDRLTRTGLRECRRLCREGKVRHVFSIDHALKVLDAEARLGRALDQVIESR